jgi:hypothetical protein
MLCCLNKGQGCCDSDDDMDPGGYGAPLPVILTLRANTNRSEIRGELDSPPRSPPGGRSHQHDIFRSPPSTPVPPHPISGDHSQRHHDRDSYSHHPVKHTTGYPVRQSHGGQQPNTHDSRDPLPFPHPPSAFQSGYSGQSLFLTSHRHQIQHIFSNT